MCHYNERTTAAEGRRAQEAKPQNAVQERAKRVEELLGNAMKPAEDRQSEAPLVRESIPAK